MAANVQMDSVRARYASDAEVAKYAGRALAGLLPWEETVVGRHFPPVGRLLDIGCGGGREAFAFAGRGWIVTAVDISEAQLQQARMRSRELGHEIDFRVCDGVRQDAPDEAFDVVVMFSQVLGNVPGVSARIAALREARRVLRTGGVLVFSVHDRDVCEPAARAQGLIRSEGDPEPGDYLLIDGGSQIPCYWHYFTQDEIHGLCRQSDFEVLQCCRAEDLGQTGWNSVWVCVCRKGGPLAHSRPACAENGS